MLPIRTLRASHQRSYDALVRNTSSSDSAEAVVANGVSPTLMVYGAGTSVLYTAKRKATAVNTATGGTSPWMMLDEGMVRTWRT